MKNPASGKRARDLLRGARSLVLSTHSVQVTGYPYGSTVPHLSDQAGRPVILISHLAEHTHNIHADARVSTFVVGDARDVQAAARASILGNAIAEERADVRERYLRFFPDHARYLKIGGFSFWYIEPVGIRLIQGFGSQQWLQASDYLAPLTAIAAIERSILHHMNEDHVEAMRSYCSRHYGIQPVEVAMVGFDCDGFDLRADGQLLRFTLPEQVESAEQAREALIAMAHACRA